MWEHDVYEWKGGANRGLRDLRAILTEKGRQGWELVTMHQDATTTTVLVVLKRPAV